jgi:hypothetical protein
MKRGLVSPDQLAYTKINDTIEGDALGPYIVQVVDPADEFEVGSPFYWVDCPDETIGYLWYYDVATSTAIGGSTVVYYSINTATLGKRVFVWPPATPQPAETTNLDPGSGPTGGPAGSTLYWWTVDAPSNQWAWSFFDPNEYSTLVTAVPYLKGERITPYAVLALDFQLRNTSPQSMQSADLLTLQCTDYPVTYGTYYNSIVVKEQAQEDIVTAATTLQELFPYNPEGWSTAYP